MLFGSLAPVSSCDNDYPAHGLSKKTTSFEEKQAVWNAFSWQSQIGSDRK